jgi:purine-binding chemotaxis protein CheW
MPNAPTAAAKETEAARRFLTFRMDEKLYALPAEGISEIIRLPHVSRVPQGPKSLLGLANLRGSVVPVASLRGLLGRSEVATSELARAIVLDGAAPIAVAVDAVDALVSVAKDEVETRQAELAADEGEVLQGAFRFGAAKAVAKILDVPKLLDDAFAQRPRAAARVGKNAAGQTAAEPLFETAEDRQMLVTFEIGGQEFGLGLETVLEIADAPESGTAIPRAELLVVGVISFADGLLPLLSLRTLLGFAPAELNGQQKVIVTAIRGVLVGLVVDKVRAILQAQTKLIDPLPAVLAARTGGEARIKAIYRGENGRRLISILHPEQLFREDVMQRLGAGLDSSQARDAHAPHIESEDIQFLVFRLEDDEFALPIAAVDEVARVPDSLSRLPKTPKFLEGVVNLRGEVLPVVDQRKRFDMPKAKNPEGRRLIVVRTARHRAGLIVDSVSEVLRTPPDAIKPPPNLTEDTARLIHGVINLEKQNRMVLVLDPAELLTRAERSLLDAFEERLEPARL